MDPTGSVDDMYSKLLMGTNDDNSNSNSNNDINNELGDGEEYLKDYEILGESNNIQRIKKLFENSSIKIKVVQQPERPTAQDTFQCYSAHNPSSNTTNCNNNNNNNKKDTAFNSTTKKDYGSSEDSSGFDSEDEAAITIPRPVSPAILNRKNMILVQSRIKNLRDTTLITPTRTFLLEGMFVKRKQRYIFFLFDDLLVITKAKENCDLKPGSPRQVKFRKALDLHHLVVQPLPDSPNKDQNLLKLRYTKSNKKWKRVYASPTKEQREVWFVEFCKLRDSLKSI